MYGGRWRPIGGSYHGRGAGATSPGTAVSCYGGAVRCLRPSGDVVYRGSSRDGGVVRVIEVLLGRRKSLGTTRC